MTKEELEKAYFWELKAFTEGAMDVMDLIALAYRGGYNDGLADAKDKDYDS